MSDPKPMKICVFSDSHGRAANLVRAVRREEPSLCFFLGDGERDLNVLSREFPSLPVHAVRGNCDLRSELPRTLCCAVGGVTIFAAHGHLYDVKYDPALHELSCAAAEQGAQLVLFGHTHIPFQETVSGREYLNPGAIGSAYRPSYGLIYLENGGFRTEIRCL